MQCGTTASAREEHITIGSALNIFGFDTFPMGVGFWAQIVSVAIALAGTLLLLNTPAGD